SDGAVIIPTELEGVMPDNARVLFSDLPQRPAGVIDLAARPAPSKTCSEIGDTPAESDGFVRLLGIDQGEKSVEPVLYGPVVAETRFGRPSATSGQVTDAAAVKRINIGAWVIDVIAGNHPVWFTAIVGNCDPAVRRQNDISPRIEMIVGADRSLSGGEASNRGVGSGGLIRQRERLQREFVIRHGSQ